MAPYFQTAKSFGSVSVRDNGVDTAEFLQASDDFVNMFDLLGSGIFGFVQTDLRNNIGGVKGRFHEAAPDSATLEDLVRSESKQSHRRGTGCLINLIRGLLFTCQALQNMQSDRHSELHVCFKRSYDAVLKPHHTFIIRSVVSVAIRAVPRRHDFYNRVAEGGPHDEFDEALTKWLIGLEVIVKRMKDFLEQGGYGKI